MSDLTALRHQHYPRVTYSADNTEALVVGLTRLAEEYSFSLGASDRTNMIEMLRVAEQRDTIHLEEWTERQRERIQNSPQGQPFSATANRQFMVNLLCLLFAVAWWGYQDGYQEYQVDWATDFYTSIMETLDIELV